MRDKPDIAGMLREIENFRASLPPEERIELERKERLAQRESWVRGMAPCEHGDPDWETCSKCLERVYAKDAKNESN